MPACSYRCALLVLTLAAIAPSEALAQDAYCINPSTRQVDPRGTAAWQQLAQQADPRVMQMLVGTWRYEVRAPATNQIEYHADIYEPGGLYQYRSKVCGGMANSCFDYQGTGLYAARQLADGSFFGMIIVSDLNRDHQCGSLSGRFTDQNTIVNSTGGISRRDP